jgi:predicted nucleic acid-binding protein
MNAQRFSVDTNILIYSIDADAGTRHEQARAVMGALPDADCVLTLQALAEFFHAVTRKDKMPAAEAAAMVHDWMELFPVAVADGRSLTGAIRLKHSFRTLLNELSTIVRNTCRRHKAPSGEQIFDIDTTPNAKQRTALDLIRQICV